MGFPRLEGYQAASEVMAEIPTPSTPARKASVCPVCEYYAGVTGTCVRCGARINKSISVRAARKIAIAGSVAGIALLWIAAYLKVPPHINIGDISEPMNNALVRVEGLVTRIDYSEEDNSFRMTLNDGTGQIRINAINRLRAFRRVHGEKMPRLRDRLAVTGVLSISQAWGNSMFLSIPDRMEILARDAVEDKDIGEITLADEGSTYWITARVQSYREFTTRSGGLIHMVRLSDGTGSIDMPLFETQYESLPEDTGNRIRLRGTEVRVMANIGSYRDEPQLEPADPSDPYYFRVLD